MTNVLDLVGLAPYGRAWPSQLSGGMEKRVALARALVNRPRLLLLDEPFSALDEPTKYHLQDQLADLHSNEGPVNTIVVSHDVDEAVYLSDRIVILTSKPTTVSQIIPIDLEYPRDRLSGGFRQACSSVMDAVFLNSLGSLPLKGPQQDDDSYGNPQNSRSTGHSLSHATGPPIAPPR